MLCQIIQICPLGNTEKNSILAWSQNDAIMQMKYSRVGELSFNFDVSKLSTLYICFPRKENL